MPGKGIIEVTGTRGAFALGALLFSWAKVQGAKSEEMGGKARAGHSVGAKKSAPIWKNQ